MSKLLKTAFIKSIPVMAGYLVLGFGFGVLSAKSGYGPLWALAMSLFIYAGSMQYVTVSLLSSGASLIAAALSTLLINARHLFYGITMIRPYEKAGKLKPYLIFALTDETYSLVLTGEAPEGLDFHRYAFFVSLFHHAYWVLGSLAGALVGSLVAFNSAGVEFAMTALFITVFVEQWLQTKEHLPALTGLIVTAGCLTVFGPQDFLIPSMLLICVFLTLFRARLDRKEGSE